MNIKYSSQSLTQMKNETQLESTMTKFDHDYLKFQPIITSNII